MNLAIYKWLLSSCSSFDASYDCDIYIEEAAATSGTRFLLLNDEISSSTFPNSCSITAKRSFINSEVLTAI